MVCLIKACVLLLSVDLALSTLEPLTKEEKAAKKKAQKKQVKPTLKSVEDRKLIKTEPLWSEITVNHKKYSLNHVDKKEFPNDLLGFVTPWNSHGYDVAKTFGAKFNYISPVWLQLVPTSSGTIQIKGGHDIDPNWMKDVRANNTNTKIVPRLIFENWNIQLLKQVTDSQSVLLQVVQTIVEFLKEEKFNGVVLELWRQFGGQEKARLHTIIKGISTALTEQGMSTILVIPPGVTPFPEIFSATDFQLLHPYVEKFIMMTYDHHHGTRRPGPVGPMDWQLRNVLILCEHADNESFRHKLLLGMNWYGVDFRGDGQAEPILGHQYIELLKSVKPTKFLWHLKASEHSFEYREASGMHNVFYPSLKAIKKRVDAAKQFKIGLAIWEIGQGLDYFYDLL